MITFTSQEIVRLKEYLVYILNNCVPFDKQKSIFDEKGKCLWCEEWEVIEMLKYLINGKEMYFSDPPPNRLKHGLHWSKEQIEQKVLTLDNLTVEQIIEHFKKMRESFNESK